MNENECGSTRPGLSRQTRVISTLTRAVISRSIAHLHGCTARIGGNVYEAVTNNYEQAAISSPVTALAPTEIRLSCAALSFAIRRCCRLE